MGIKVFKAFSVTSIITAMVTGTVFASEYVVKPNESLSEIAHNLLPGPVWGTKGSLAQILALNPDIKNANLIFVGDAIELPGTTLTLNTNDLSSRAPAANDSTNVVLAKDPESRIASPVFLHQNDISSDTFGGFTVESGFSSTRISAMDSANGSQARLLTRSNAHYEFAYLQHWSDEFESRVYFGLQTLNFNAPDSGGNLSDSNPTMHQFGIEGRINSSQGLTLGFGLSMNQNPYLAGISAGAITVDSQYVPRFNFFLTRELYEKRPFAFGMMAGLGISAPTSTSVYSTHWDLDYSGAFFIRQNALSWLNLETGAKVSYFNQDTSISNQSMLDLSVYLKAIFPFGGSSK